MKKLLPLLVLLAISSHASAVMKCSNGAQTWYQDMPCPAGVSTSQVHVEVTGGVAPLSGSGQVITVPQEPSLPLPPPPSHIPLAVYEQEARLCLAWYQKEMQLPPDTRYLDFTKEQRVLTITLPVTIFVQNYLDVPTQSMVNKQASCEIHNGRLDDSWTRIHAQRGGWIQ